MGGDRVPGPFNDAVDEETRRRREENKRHLEGKENAEKVQEALRQARATLIAEFGKLNEVALATIGSPGQSPFLIKYAGAWLAGDAYNKRLMVPVFKAFIRNAGLDGLLVEPGQKD